MGGTGFSTRFKPLRGAKGAEGATKALYDELYAIIEDNIERVAKGKVYRQVTADFLSIAHEDGEGRDDLVSFNFRDGAGLCQASVHCCNHWFQLYLAALALKKGKAPSALDTIAERHGLALKDKIPPLKDLLKTCKEPLVELRGHVFGVSGPKKDPYIVSDELDDDGMLEMENLNAKERAKVLAASTKQRCECIVCVTLRKKVDLRLPKPKKEAKPKKPPKLGVKTSLHNEDTHRSISDDKATALPDAVFAPPTLESFYVYAPITTVPDGIERLAKLRKFGCINTNLTRIPEVFFRMPWLKEIDLSQSPIETVADLPKMPWLESISLERLRQLKGVEDVPFDAFPDLATLKLEWLGLGALPKSVTRAKKLRALAFSDPNATTLPASLADLSELESLTLNLEKLTTLPSLAKLSKLKELSIDAASLETIPDDALPPNLVELTLTLEKCTKLPASIGKLPRLTKLSLTGGFTSLPAALGKLGALKELWIYANALTSIPDAALPKGLSDLSLCDCPALKTLPNRLGDLADLKSFAAIRTGLAALPEPLRRAKNLETLRLTGAPELTALPAWLGELSKLSHLSLGRNPALGPLPASIARLKKKLTYLDLDETPGAFPLGAWLEGSALEYIGAARAGVSRDERARMKKLLPNALVS